MGSTLLHRLAEHPHARVTALHQRSHDNAIKALRRAGLGEDLFVEDYTEMLTRADVDAVFICSPNSLHTAQSIAALEAGKHVFCEKPCATDFDEYERQLEAAENHPHLVTFVNYILNFDSMEQRIREMTRQGEFGTITQIQVNYRHPINTSGEKAWKLRRDLMGDAIGMGIIHALSVMLNIMAAQEAHPIRVYATTSDLKTRPIEADSIYSIQIQFSNGASGLCLGNIDHANGYDAYHNIHGTKGGFIFDSYLDRPQKVRLWSRNGTDGKWIRPLDPSTCPPDLLWPAGTTTPDSGDVIEHQTGACVSHFLDCIRSGTPSFLGFRQSAPTAELGWAVLQSAKTGSTVDLPLNRASARAHFAS